MVKRIITIGVIVVIVAAAGVAGFFWLQSSAEAARPITATTTVKNAPLTRSVSTSGTVESETTYSVYSTLSYVVDSITVEEGQYVEKGAVLAQLDTESLELDIRQQQVTLANSETNTDLDIEGKLKAYQNATEKSNLNVDNARRSYELLANQVANGTYPELVNAKTTVDNAKTDLDNKTRTYNDNKALFDLGELSQQTLDQSKSALDAAQRAYDTAVSNQQNTIKRVNDDVETSRKNYQSTQVTASQEISNARRQYENAQITASTETTQIALEKLQKQLADSTITAPVSGVVTKVYAKEGNPGSGLLFIIEDLDKLEILTKVKEYDAASVQPGMPVIIKSDATGDKEIRGRVKSVAPTSAKNSAGQTVTANVVEYDTIVTVDDPDSGLKVGMNTRLSIILEQKDMVLQVPYDAVNDDGNGNLFIFVVEPRIEGNVTRYVARSLPVTVGMETDFAVEISGDGLSEGVQIVSDPTSVYEGADLKLQGAVSSPGGMAGMVEQRNQAMGIEG